MIIVAALTVAVVIEVAAVTEALIATVIVVAVLEHVVEVL